MRGLTPTVCSAVGVVTRRNGLSAHCLPILCSAAKTTKERDVE
jgi:hypothetical protein